MVGTFIAFGSTCEEQNIGQEIKIDEEIISSAEIIKDTKNIEEIHIVLNVAETEPEIIETKEYIPNYISKTVPDGNSFKSYMSYTAITSKSSPQYKLQQQAYTGDYGIRMVEDRYCIALGTYYTSIIGTKIDLVMQNGSIIPCILGDVKANQHTCSSNIRARDGSVVEFIIDRNTLHNTARRMGNISYAADKFAGEILEIRIYQE